MKFSLDKNLTFEQAKQILEAEGCTCVICGAGGIYKSDRRGVAPLLALLDMGTDMTGASAADRVVGKATAFLYGLLGVKQVYARVMSRPAAGVLEEAGIEGSTSLKITHEKIANHMGTAREVVTRMLRYFQGEGMVRLTRGTVVLTDKKRLAKL